MSQAQAHTAQQQAQQQAQAAWARSDQPQALALRVSGEALRAVSPRELDDTACALSWRVQGLHGHESVDELFEYTLRLKRSRRLDPRGLWNPRRMTGRALTVHIALPGGGLEHAMGPSSWGWERGWRPLCALVGRAEHVGWDGSDDEFELRLHPWLYLAGLRSQCRIYQHMDVQRMLERLLRDYPGPVRWQLQQRHARRDYQVQFHETDLEFFHRLVQEWGIHYHFEHQVGRCELVLGDGPASFGQAASQLYRELPCVHWHGPHGQPPPRAGANPECLQELQWREQLVATSWAASDYDYLRPRRPLRMQLQDAPPGLAAQPGGVRWRGLHGADVARPGRAARPSQAPRGDLGDPDDPEDPHAQAAMLGAARLQAQSQLAARAWGRGALRAVCAGQRLRVTGHALAQCNDSFVVLHARLALRAAPAAPGSWLVQAGLLLQPCAQPVRPLQRQPKPSLAGLQTAEVVAAQGAGAAAGQPWVDALGRIRVRMHWDRHSPPDERASCWVRVATPAAGSRAGQVWLPRPGQEVLISLVDGDADSPVCVGAVYGAANPPPWRLPAHCALSGMRSCELPGGAGGGAGGPACERAGNQLVFDDTPGRLQAQLASDRSRSRLALGSLHPLPAPRARGPQPPAPAQAARGEGFELRSDGQVAVRALRGLLLSTHARPGACGAVLELQEPLRLLRRARLGWLAQLRAASPSVCADPAFDSQRMQWLQSLRAQIEAERRQARPGSQGQRLHGQLLLASAGALLASSGGAMHWVGRASLGASAAGAIDLHAAGRLVLAARQGLRLLAQRAGMFLVARAGLVQLQAPGGDLELCGRRVQVQSRDGWVRIRARDQLVLRVGGSCLRLSDEGIDIRTPGALRADAASHAFDGAAGLARPPRPAPDEAAGRRESPPPRERRHARIVPIVFLPGIMGSNLRISRERQHELGLQDNRGWRPDDLGLTTLLGLSRFGSFLKNATPRQRQLHFDPQSTEVDRYDGTDDPAHFDASPGDDRRHDNLPSSLEVEPLVARRPAGDAARFDLAWSAGQRDATARRKARLRGWSEVYWKTYGPVLAGLEDCMNNIRSGCGGAGAGAARPRLDGRWLPLDSRRAGFGLGGLRDIGPVGVPPARWGRLRRGPARPLAADEVLQLGDAIYPVHAMGYNWLRPTADSAREVAARIQALVRSYAAQGAAQGASCEHVLLLTHSMGGLLARSLTDPRMGGLPESMLGGVVFTVMPTFGAATAYKRMRAGMSGEGGLLECLVVNRVLGASARQSLPVVANASGPLELFPAADYGDDWLKVRWTDHQGRVQQRVLDVQRAIGDCDCWWRALHPEWINPANQPADRSSFRAAARRLQQAALWHEDLAQAEPLPNSHALYGCDRRRPAWGEVVWVAGQPLPAQVDPDPATWTLLHDDALGGVRVASHGVEFELRIAGPADAGDGTVPAERSAAKAAVQHALWQQQGYDHQDCFTDDATLAATLWGLVRSEQLCSLDQDAPCKPSDDMW